ncbi:2-oxoacid:acceptor oxidoreductase family protein [Ferrovum myxofaciens]|jgi:pyruvate ferredoxin oxidoreductase gamma subunit|uniref:2-oxoacid:acceptor oxidoreductase family protein n=2 Tax=root TaxID=1 RepID=A0A9E6N040_9PROT|nr:2-oxoacid:acceptor oxidoreductase family protein [Ferrovum myxofaciens]MBU6993764.1 2-oxoacid:acceptor oxidoreductase family protein [Ferrovum myxofaciens]QKE37838.1 MAG: 2-oxoacid:acceptor oxidoreductase family protein [Ferrovum myxofaciens]QKE40470.1 MAG: 2-oxoacid:acceptor oxidoreductase [Ferrovum myxofaciens]QWY75514.1 MAG: 2-oxoacid:acceptor oxidoreductase family protein [Ferrovum myxofaciens]QWY78252.1 MAG: 2-oxoacid:acceptor oxidoreductase family protein [Ferrovum myxofaciens]
MFELRIHGRGGQGVVTAAEIFSISAFVEGRNAQAFPSFGSERMGAPVVSFCRIADREIRLREPVMEPDALIIQDITLLHQVDVFDGLKKDGYILLNTGRSFEELGLSELAGSSSPERLCTLSATEIALKHIGRPIPNVPLIAGFAALSGLVRLESVIKAISEKFSGKVADGNIAAATEAYNRIKARALEVTTDA